jgi:hypothetical protein
MSAVALDHVGVVTRDLSGLARQYETLGFTLTPLARQTDGRIGNRCAMLRQGYIELLSVVDPNARSPTLDRFLARYAGIHIVAIAIADEQTVLARLRRGGIVGPSITQVGRAIDDRDISGPHARFAFIQLPEQPEGRINLVHHLTPEVLWQKRFLHHPNNATALVEVTIIVDEPADAAARFSRLAGCPAVPDPAGGFTLDLRRGRVRLLPDTALCVVFPGVALPDLPRIVGLTLHTADRNKALRRLLDERGVGYSQHGDALLVDPDAAGGVALRFLPTD